MQRGTYGSRSAVPLSASEHMRHVYDYEYMCKGISVRVSRRESVNVSVSNNEARCTHTNSEARGTLTVAVIMIVLT